MNQLTKSLLEDLLDIQKTVAIFGGGFKPPTKGHFDVVKLALDKYPEIDELKIFVGGGIRDGITQEESIKIWDIYKKYLSPKVDVEPSIAPVKSILGYAKENPDTKVYWILGAREEEEGDLLDIKNRTKTISKYPNLEVKIISNKRGISGTKTRNTVKNNDKEQFFQLIPDIEEKQQVWNIVSPVVKEETINEVGEANLKPYKWEEVDINGWVTYTEFTTESETEYKVNLTTTTYGSGLNNIKALEVEFSAKPKGAEGSSTNIVVNKGELYRVMATITAIIKYYVKKFKAEAIMYSPSKKSDEEDFGLQRDNLYKAFISKAIPGIKFKQNGGFIIAILPNTIKETVTATEVICDNCGWEWSIADGGEDLYICHKCGHDNNPDLEEASDPQAGTALPYGSGFAPVKEYSNTGPSTPKVYIVKADGNYKEVSIGILSKISNLIYDMGGGETNYYPEKNIVIIDNIPIEEFVKDPGEIKDEKIYVEYNLNQPYSFPKANKIIAAQLVYNLDNVESFATTVNNSLKDNGTFEFYSDVMIKKDKDFLNYLYSEYGFGFPKNLNQWKQEPIQLKKGKFVEPTISYIYNITDTNGNTAKISVTKEGRWWKYDKIEGNINFKPVQWSVEPEYKYNDITPSKENVLNTFSKALETNIVDFKKLNENLKETVTDTEVICDNCGWEWPIADGGDDLYTCHKCGHNNNPNLEEAKQEVKDSMVVVLSRKDNQINLYDLKTNEALGVINTYGNEVTGVAAKKGYGPLMYELGMANVYPNGLQSDRHGNTEPAAEDVWKKYIAGVSPNIKVQKLTPEDKDYRTTYAGDGYDSSYLPDFYNYKFYNPDTATLKQLIQKGNILSDELKKQIVLDSDKLYSNMVRESNSKDPFGLNELAQQFLKETLKETWKPKESFVSLCQYMIDNGMNIKPLPKIKVINNDVKNASNLLGKTAYYNPTDKSITLYTMDRHPKDILRSFSHEMIHHQQNLEGKLNNINTTNTREDGDLPEIEREAYEKGNMMLRGWEDSIKNK